MSKVDRYKDPIWRGLRPPKTQPWRPPKEKDKPAKERKEKREGER